MNSVFNSFSTFSSNLLSPRILPLISPAWWPSSFLFLPKDPAINSVFLNFSRISSFLRALSLLISSLFLFFSSSFLVLASSLCYFLLSSTLLIESSGASLAWVVRYALFFSSNLKLYFSSYLSISESRSLSSLSILAFAS